MIAFIQIKPKLLISMSCISLLFGNDTYVFPTIRPKTCHYCFYIECERAHMTFPPHSHCFIEREREKASNTKWIRNNTWAIFVFCFLTQTVRNAPKHTQFFRYCVTVAQESIHLMTLKESLGKKKWYCIQNPWRSHLVLVLVFPRYIRTNDGIVWIRMHNRRYIIPTNLKSLQATKL